MSHKLDIPLLKRLWRFLFKQELYSFPDGLSCRITDIVVSIDDQLIDSHLSNDPLLEWSRYEPIPNTHRYARKDIGQSIPGKEWHIHVFASSKNKNCLYAINADGSSHDGSKAYVQPDDCIFLRSKGINVPENGFFLEWRTVDEIKQLLLD